MNFVELKICEKVGGVLKICSEQVHNSVEMVEAWVKSETFEGVVDGDVSLFPQSRFTLLVRLCKSIMSRQMVKK